MPHLTADQISNYVEPLRERYGIPGLAVNSAGFGIARKIS